MRGTGDGGRGKGTTLIELVVALAVLGLILGISGLALASLRAPREGVRQLQRARAEAIQKGQPVRAAGTVDTVTNYAPRTTHSVLFLPDGRAIGPGVDPLTGAPRAQ